ncbi:RHS repeat-associated core domain-containing protein [Streptomyces sp. CCNWLW238]
MTPASASATPPRRIPRSRTPATATGLPRTTPAEAVPQPYRYTGAYADPTGLYKMGHRYYDPTLGRFTQPDPSGQETNPQPLPRRRPHQQHRPYGSPLRHRHRYQLGLPGVWPGCYRRRPGNCRNGGVGACKRRHEAHRDRHAARRGRKRRVRNGDMRVNSRQIITVLGTVLMVVGAVIALMSGPVWLATVLIAGACCGLAGVLLGRRK